MFPFMKLTDNVVTLRPLNLGRKRIVQGGGIIDRTQTVDVGLMKVTSEVAANFIAITRAQGEREYVCFCDL
jgi:hypothetical protein